MNKRYWAMLLALIMSMGFLWGCQEALPMDTGRKSESVNYDRYELDTAVREEAAGEFTSEESADARKVIYHYDLSMECLDGQKVMSDLATLLKKYEGYILDSSVDMDTPYGLQEEAQIRHIYYVWRIKSDQAENFVNELKTIAVATSTQIRREDQTIYYQDTETRLENKRKEEERLLELLDKAEDMADVITIEERLNQLRYEIESLEGNLREVDRDVNESTITANIRVVQAEDISTAQGKPFLERVSDYFGISLRVLRDGAEQLLYILIVFGPWLILLALLITLIIYLVRRSNRKQRLRRREEEMAFYQRMQAGGMMPPSPGYPGAPVNPESARAPEVFSAQSEDQES